ncbi:MAG: hypothetical protein OHK0053_31590 [Microscillaceae bacterium]
MACDVPAPYGDLRILVIDDRDDELANAEVTLYLSEADYNIEQNPYRGPSLTDSEGNVAFLNLEDTVYYVNVVKGNLNNWESAQVRRKIIITENGFSNRQIYALSDNRSGRLSSPAGKGWRIQQVFFEGEDISDTYTACLRDNVFRFFKGGSYQEEEETLACTPGQLVIPGRWQFSSDGTQLTLTSAFSTQVWTIITLTTSQLRISYNTTYESVFGEIEIILSSS